ncbi:MAG: hypothetical protein GC160_27215 [Acidobacteria bacterium]|nr:hypothetical protein [Acidobacteriota bacterium]
MLRPLLCCALLAAPLLADEAFLVRFGGAEPADWSGSVRVEGGDLADLAGWQFDEGDSIDATARSWSAHTVSEEYWYAPWERSLFGTKQQTKVSERGVLLRVAMKPGGTIRVTAGGQDIAFQPEQIAWRRSKSFLGGKVRVERVPVSERLEFTAGLAAEDEPSALRTSDGTLWLAWQTYSDGGDRLWVRRADAAPEPLTDAGRSLFRVRLAPGAGGSVWAVWSEMRNDDWNLVARLWSDGSWGPEQNLTTAAGNDIFHSVAAADGRLAVVWQSFRDGQGEIYLKTFDGSRWTPDRRLSESPANDWEPTVALSGDRIAVFWDGYGEGNYDVYSRVIEGDELGPVQKILSTPSFEARPQVVVDAQGRPWFAWEEGDSQWGKDYVNGTEEAGMGLLMRRVVRVAVHSAGKLQQLPGEPFDRLPAEAAHTMTTPRLAFDGNGAPWLFFRFRTNTPRRNKPTYRSMWRLGAVTFSQGGWSDLIELPLGYGRIDAPTAVAPDGHGGLDVFWGGDGRTFPRGFPGDQDLYQAHFQPAPASGPLPLIAYGAPTQAFPAVHPDEAADVARLRNYRVRSGGQTLQIVRGDMHRHTDISWDGNRDGSLFDCYRYAMDAAAMDYLGVADHNAGDDWPYHWRLGQRGADLFQIPGKFAPLYGYERSRGYPSGHRNVMFARRGVPVFGFLPEEINDNKNAGVGALYAHLRDQGGIVMSHTSATGAGTDWRDSDAEVETLMEIYQGYRSTYEHEGAPRADDPVERPAGLVWNAWKKGIKLGLQSSSDHVSTHSSYGMIWVESVEPGAVLDGIRQRRAYAATDNILVDFRVNGHLMGSSFTAEGKPRLEAKVVGTGPIARIEVIRNNEFIYTQPGGAGAAVEFEYVDNQPPTGENWYYIRVEQQDGELAWASPVWVTVR